MMNMMKMKRDEMKMRSEQQNCRADRTNLRPEGCPCPLKVSPSVRTDPKVHKHKNGETAKSKTKITHPKSMQIA
jgi:hypothetical protein